MFLSNAAMVRILFSADLSSVSVLSLSLSGQGKMIPDRFNLLNVF